MDNSQDGSRALEVLYQHDRAEQRIDQGGIVTRTLSESRRMPCWIIMVMGVAGGESLRTILSVVAGYI